MDGTSLAPLLRRGDAAGGVMPGHVVSQFHGENLAMSWYMIRRAEMKLVVWGTGEQHEPQLFNLTADPDEWHNLARGVGTVDPVTRRYAGSTRPAARGKRRREQRHPFLGLVNDLDALLRTDIDYPSVTRDVASYNIKMAKWWMGAEPHWKGVLGGTANASWSQPPGRNILSLNADWGELWKEHPPRYWHAWNEWLNVSDAAAETPEIPKCPSVVEHGWGK